MRLPVVREIKQNLSFVQTFKGYNHNLRKISSSNGRTYDDASSFYDMKNMCGDFFPVASTRQQRTQILALTDTPYGLYAKEGLLRVRGNELVYSTDEITWEVIGEVEESPKQFASIGAYVLIMPDKKVFNTQTLELTDIEFSYSTHTWTRYVEDVEVVTTSYLKMTPCLMDGGPIEYYASATEPEDKTVYWYDTANNVIKKYDSGFEMWRVLETVYIRIEPILETTDDYGYGEEAAEWLRKCKASINEIDVYDTIRLSNLKKKDDTALDYNGDNVVYGKGDGFLVVVGLIPEITIAKFTMSRPCPDMDYICAMSNRIWGCSSANREVYACKLGDPTQWYNYAGLSSDSYAATIGSDGIFTGAAAYNNYIYFFKKDRLHKVFGNYPSSFQITETTVNGVQEGSAASLCVVNGLLFYKGEDDVMAFDGSLPYSVSENFGNEKYHNARAGYQMNKYYLNMQDASDNWVLFVYDTYNGLWFKEDDSHILYATTLENQLYTIQTAIDEDTHQEYDILTKAVGSYEGNFDWFLETGNLGLDNPYQKYYSKVVVRIAFTGTFKIEVAYDENAYTEVYSRVSETLRSYAIPINVKRCDHFRLKLSGKGQAKIYSFAFAIETGSEIC